MISACSCMQQQQRTAAVAAMLMAASKTAAAAMAAAMLMNWSMVLAVGAVIAPARLRTAVLLPVANIKRLTLANHLQQLLHLDPLVVQLQLILMSLEVQQSRPHLQPVQSR